MVLAIISGSMAAGEIAAGLVSSERQGRSRIYRLERKRLDLVSEWLAHFSRRPDHQEGN
ncbi:hypothetical protein GCM10023196_097460 [Actinoallomurus vinaceus]|uniref:Uncharacterized protein n=1 Tax=Actinoallomurus vinaceus TaxID=1080074 RepID=A0ABP8US08_9ACTN